MRIKVTLTVDIDPDAWCEAYGTTREGVRDDVRTYVTEGALSQLQDLGLLAQDSSAR